MNRKQFKQAVWKVNETIVYIEDDEQDYAICNTADVTTQCLPYEICLELAQQIAADHNKKLRKPATVTA